MPTPTTTLPPRPTKIRNTYVDFVFALDYLSINSGLLKIMQEAMAAYGLSSLLVNKSSVEQTLQAVRKGRLKPHLYLDLCSRPGDPFYALLEAMAAVGVHTLCDPKSLPYTFKAFSHPPLERAGLPLPPSVIIRRDEPDRDLTPDELARVGDRCVIKPSYGVAGLGAVINAAPDRASIAKAREFNRADDWLVQKMIRWNKLPHRDAYLRGYNVLGYRTLMWWSNDHGYQRLTWDDFHKHDLAGAVELIDRVAAVTNVEFFSSEIAITADPGAPDRFCLIDYVNDQCDIDPDAAPGRSPPREWVRWVCHRMAELTWRKKHALPPLPEGTLHLADAADAR
jgi:hypothetical protein